MRRGYRPARATRRAGSVAGMDGVAGDHGGGRPPSGVSSCAPFAGPSGPARPPGRPAGRPAVAFVPGSTAAAPPAAASCPPRSSAPTGPTPDHRHPQADVIVALGGNDVIDGLGGNDRRVRRIRRRPAARWPRRRPALRRADELGDGPAGTYPPRRRPDSAGRATTCSSAAPTSGRPTAAAGPTRSRTPTPAAGVVIDLSGTTTPGTGTATGDGHRHDRARPHPRHDRLTARTTGSPAHASATGSTAAAGDDTIVAGDGPTWSTPTGCAAQTAATSSRPGRGTDLVNSRPAATGSAPARATTSSRRSAREPTKVELGPGDDYLGQIITPGRGAVGARRARRRRDRVLRPADRRPEAGRPVHRRPRAGTTHAPGRWRRPARSAASRGTG